jgi:hypothetical protein
MTHLRLRLCLFATAIVLLATGSAAFDCKGSPSGTLRWFHNTSASDVGDASHIVNNTVFVAVGDGNPGNSSFYAFDADTGAVNWVVAFPLQYNVRQKMPTAYHGVVLLVVGFGQVWALDQRTGVKVWQFQSDLHERNDWTSNPQVDPATGLVFTSSITTLYALDINNGQAVWQQPLNNARLGTGSTAWVEGGVVYITSDDGMNAFLAESGTVLWKMAWGWQDSSVQVQGTASAAVCHSPDGDRQSPPALAVLASGTWSNWLLGFSSQDGTPLFNFTLPDTIGNTRCAMVFARACNSVNIFLWELTHRYSRIDFVSLNTFSNQLLKNSLALSITLRHSLSNFSVTFFFFFFVPFLSRTLSFSLSFSLAVVWRSITHRHWVWCLSMANNMFTPSIAQPPPLTIIHYHPHLWCGNGRRLQMEVCRCAYVRVCNSL